MMRRFAALVGALVVLSVAGLALAQFSIEAQVRRMLDAWAANPPAPLASFRYRDVAYDIAERKLTVTGVEFASATAVRKQETAIERIELVDFNPALLEKIANPDLYRDGRGDGAFARLATSGRAVGIRGSNDSGRFRTAEMTVRQISARQFAEAPTAAAFSKE